MITLSEEQARQIEEAMNECLFDAKWYAAKEAIRAAKAQELNLNCKSVQKRLATSWGYVKAEHTMDYDQGFVDGVEAQLAEPVKQQPVAVISESAIGLVKLHANGACLPFGTQLYAAPVSAKREWVDITKAEQLYLLASHIDKLTGDVMGLSLIDAVVAKFKEKNK